MSLAPLGHITKDSGAGVDYLDDVPAPAGQLSDGQLTAHLMAWCRL